MSVKTNRILFSMCVMLLVGIFATSSVNALESSSPQSSASGGGGYQLPPTITWEYPTTTPINVNEGDIVEVKALAEDQNGDIITIIVSYYIDNVLIDQVIIDVNWQYSYLVEYEIDTSIIGEHGVVVEVWDYIYPNPTIDYRIINVIATQQNTCDLIQDLIDLVESTEECDWRNPELNRKNVMLNKLDVCLDLCEAGLYEELEDKLNHDIRPKLTAEKIDGKAFKNAWIITSGLYQTFEDSINAIIDSLSNGETPPMEM